MMNKKRRFTYGFFIFLLCLGIIYVISRSFAYEVVTKNNQNASNAQVSNVEDTADYVYFSIKKLNSTDTIGGKVTIRINKAYSTVNTTTLKARVEYSANNSAYTTYGDSNLVVNGDVVTYEVLELPYETTYFRISLYNNGTRLDLTKRNVDCTITVNSTTTTTANYFSNTTFTAPRDGIYRVELWGAGGNYYPASMKDQIGVGAYTRGDIRLTSGTNLLFNIGAQRRDTTFGQSSTGGGGAGEGAKNLDGSARTSCNKGESCSYSAGGGGATDVRLNSNLNSRIMVAAGGGGNVYYDAGEVVGIGGDGGGLVGYYAGSYGTYYSPGIRNQNITEADGGVTNVGTSMNTPHDFAFGGTQKRGGLTNSGSSGGAGTFGVGGNGNGLSAGGGGGYYGGAGGGRTRSYNGSRSGYTPGAGGSSFIAGHTGSISSQMSGDGRCTESNNGSGTYYRPENYVGTTANACSIVTVNSKQYAFTNTQMIDGRGYSWTNTRGSQVVMPTPPSGGSAEYGRTINGAGNVGSGAARITYVNPNGPSGTATWNKKATVHIYVNYKDMNGTNIASPIDQIYDPEVNYCYYGPDQSVTSHRVVDRIEVSPNNYDICGTTADEDIHITYYYDWDSHPVITSYLDQYENYEDIDNATIDIYKHNDPYVTSCKSFEYYTFVRLEGDPLTGNADSDKFVRCIYERRKTRITINYLEDGTSRVLMQPTVIEEYYGNDYNVSPLSILNYAFVRVQGAEHGTCNADSITINYYYRIQQSDIYINHVDCQTGAVLSPQERVTATAGAHYDVSDRRKDNIAGYRLENMPPNATGTYVGGDYEQPITVTFRYCRKDATVVANYLENLTNRVLATRYEHGVNYGDDYETFPVNIQYYRHLSTEGDYESGTVNKDLVQVNYYYERKIGTLTVKYLDYDSNIELSPTERTNVKWGLTYQTTSKTIPNYYVFRVEGDESGTVEGDETEVIYYYKRSEGTVTTRYINEADNGAISDNVTRTYYYGDVYTTEQKVIPNYEFVRVSGSPTGIFAGNITIIYYYRLKDATLTVRHLDIDDNHTLFPDEVTNTKWGRNYTTSRREFTGYNYVKVEGPAAGDVDSDDLVVTYYYSRKTYTLTVRHLENGTSRILAETETNDYRYRENYTTLPKVINNYKVYQVPSNANGRIEENTTVTYYYAKKDGELVIRYINEETGENIIAPEIRGVDFGESYEAYSFENGRRVFDNYEFVRVVGTEKGVIESERTEVIYYYRLRRGSVVVKYLDINTNQELIDSRQYDYNYGDNYSTIEEEIDGYNFDHVEGVTSGVFSGNVEVRYYYRKINLTVTIHFKEEVTEAPLAADIIQYKNYGDRYTTSRIDIDNYLYTRVDGNERGTMIRNVEVTYYYKKRDAKVIVKYLEKDTNIALKTEEEIDVHWGDEYTTEPAEIENYKVVEAPTNAYGIVDSNEIIVIYYYGHRDATVITKYLEDGTNRQISSQDRRGYNYGENYVTYQRDIYSYEFVRSEGNTYGIVNDEEITVTYFYKKTTRTLTVKYLELDTETKIADDEVTTMDYGTIYQTSRKQLPNYNFYRVIGDEYGRLENNITVTYYYTRKLSTLIVRHLDFETNDELAREEISTVRYGEEYETNPKEIRYYIYNSVSGIPSGVVNSDNITVTYFYIPKPSQVISHYLDVDTEREIADPESQTVVYGEYYITRPSGGIPKNYEFLRKTPNYEGVATEDTIDVNYYYQKIDSNVTTTLNLYGTNEISDASEDVTYYIEYKAKVKDYIGDGKITIVDKLPYPIHVEASELDMGTYNESDNTITWVIDWDNINTFENEDEIVIEKNISIVYDGIKGTDRSINNNVSATLKLDNNTRRVEADLATRINIYGTIVIHHYLEGTNNQLFLDEIIDGLIGDTYITHEQTIEGFELVRRPLQETLTFEEESFDVIYEYRKKMIHITTEVIGGVGDITGSEDVFYEHDSTPDYIVITPGNGYEIESITINDEDIEITDPKGMTLENFIGLTEDKNIKVSFTEESIEVPITGKNSKLIVIFILLALMVTITLLVNKTKNKILKIER